jgi:mannose-6-phosphate isomerase-like protein (cupin superfamily)
MAYAGDEIHNPVTGQRLRFLVTPADSHGELFRAEGAFPPGGFAGVDHVHPHQDEHFEVLAGQAEFRVDGKCQVLGPGERIDVPAGTVHTFSNGGAGEPRVMFEFRPGLSSTDRFYELYFAFAQEGRVNAKAMPGLLDVATVWPETAEHAVLARPHAWAQHALFRALAPIARIRRAASAGLPAHTGCRANAHRGCGSLGGAFRSVSEESTATRDFFMPEEVRQGPCPLRCSRRNRRPRRPRRIVRPACALRR